MEPNGETVLSGLPEGQQRNPPAATALNCGILCRCGMGPNGETALSRLSEGQQRNPPATTAPNCGILCRCGMGPNGETVLSGLPEGQQRNPPAATAPNCGILCRCGTEWWYGLEWRALHRWPDEWVAGWLSAGSEKPFLHTGKDMKCKNEKAQSQSLPQ